MLYLGMPRFGGVFLFSALVWEAEVGMLNLEISKDGELQGLVTLGWDGFTALSSDWFKEILTAGGYTFEEVRVRDF